MNRLGKIVVAILLLAGVMSGLLGFQNKIVGYAGDSISRYQMGFQSYELPFLPPQNVHIFGQDGLTCRQLQPLMKYMIPANADVAVLLGLPTNDISQGLSVYDHINCVWQIIGDLTSAGRNPNVKILLVNEHPFTQGNCVGDVRDLIDTYNQAYWNTPWPNNVTVVDTFTPNAGPDRWAIPSHIDGFCGVHPGPKMVWAGGWLYYTRALTQAVYVALRQS